MDNLQESERTAFEAWCDDYGFNRQYEEDRNGIHYATNTTRAYWVGWSARTILAQRAASVPAEAVQPVTQVPYGYVATISNSNGTVYHHSRLMDSRHGADTCASQWSKKYPSERTGSLALYATPIAATVPQAIGRDAALIDPIKLEDMRDWIVSNRPALTLSRQSTVDDYMAVLATANAIIAATPPANVALKCWSCKETYTPKQRADNDGDCPHCGAELDESPANVAQAAPDATAADAAAQIALDVVINVGTDAVGAEIILMNPLRTYKLEDFRIINGKGHGTVRMPLDEAATLKVAQPDAAPTYAVPKSHPPYSVASAVSMVYKSIPASLTQFGADVIHMQFSGIPGIPESTSDYHLPVSAQTTEKP